MLCNETEITPRNIDTGDGGPMSFHAGNALTFHFLPSCEISGDWSVPHIVVYSLSLYCGLENHNTRKRCFPGQKLDEGQLQKEGVVKKKITKARVWDLSLALLLHLSLLVLPSSTAHTSRFPYQRGVVHQLLPLICYHPWQCYFPSLELIFTLYQWEPPRAPWCLSPGCYSSPSCRKLGTTK